MPSSRCRRAFSTPYAGVSTAILLFTKTNSGGTDNVWFYDMKADGWNLDDKRQPLLSEDKLGFQGMKDGRSQLLKEEHFRNIFPDVPARWRSLHPLPASLPLPLGEGGGEGFPELKRSRTDPSFCMPKGDIAGNDYDLSINRYKEVVHAVSEHLPPKEILAKLAVLEAEIQAGRASRPKSLRQLSSYACGVPSFKKHWKPQHLSPLRKTLTWQSCATSTSHCRQSLDKRSLPTESVVQKFLKTPIERQWPNSAAIVGHTG